VPLKVAPDGGITHEQPEDAPRPPLSGRISLTHNPELKPWAVLCNRFAAKVRHVPGGAKGPRTSRNSSRPLRMSGSSSLPLIARFDSVLVALNYRSGLLLKLFDRG
jgi:hypothetical protein